MELQIVGLLISFNPLINLSYKSVRKPKFSRLNIASSNRISNARS